MEWRRYLRGLRRLGVTSVAEALLRLQLEEAGRLLPHCGWLSHTVTNSFFVPSQVGSAPLSIEAICRENLWQDVEYLRGCVAHSID